MTRKLPAGAVAKLRSFNESDVDAFLFGLSEASREGFAAARNDAAGPEQAEALRQQARLCRLVARIVREARR